MTRDFITPGNQAHVLHICFDSSCLPSALRVMWRWALVEAMHTVGLGQAEKTRAEEEGCEQTCAAFTLRGDTLFQSERHYFIILVRKKKSALFPEGRNYLYPPRLVKYS